MTVDTTGTSPDITTDPAEVVDPVDEPDTSDATDEPEVDAEAVADDARDDTAIGREAARYRRRLRDAEAANEAMVTDHTAALASAEAAHAATTDTLARQRQAILDATLAGAGLDPRLASAAGITADAVLTDDGLIDGQKLRTAVAAAVTEFGVNPRGKGPTPNKQQGNPSAGNGGVSTWGGLFGRLR